MRAQKRAQARRHRLPASRIVEIVAEVARLHGTTEIAVRGPVRAAPIVAARRDAARRLRLRGLSLRLVGQALGGRDHTTVLNLLREAA